MLKKVDRVDNGAPRVQAEHAQACAIIDGRILDAASHDFHRIHLNAISR
jgi:hypothetical protein